MGPLAAWQTKTAVESRSLPRATRFLRREPQFVISCHDFSSLTGCTSARAFIGLLGENQFSGGSSNEGTEEIPLQDLFESYVSDLYKLRDAFHGELSSTAKELSRAMDDYALRSEAALKSFMEIVAARGVELEAAAAARLDQFRGLPPTGGLPNVNDGPLAQAPPNADQVKIAAAAERAVADGLGVESDEAQKPRSGRAIALVRSEPAA